MKSFFFALISFAAISFVLSNVVTGICENDQQCSKGMCCAVSMWLLALRKCAPLGSEGDDCHPMSHKVPYLGNRKHNTCPCQPGLRCVKFADNHCKCAP
ncbi:prokineticin-2 [Amblyraja radiata]|uniref:prokineticin-2 n=1 Tax=Amblyraja radiata TaxID=386614 RepID=UPI00140410F1|nr:prokineticin-2 [Amblyraja radiata]